MNSHNEKRPLRRGELAVLVVMLVINVAMTVFFLLKTGFKSYVGIFLLMSLGWLSGCYLGFKMGFMLDGNVAIRREDDPRRFLLNMAILVLMYVCVLAIFVGLCFQELAKPT